MKFQIVDNDERGWGNIISIVVNFGINLTEKARRSKPVELVADRDNQLFLTDYNQIVCLEVENFHFEVVIDHE